MLDFFKLYIWIFEGVCACLFLLLCVYWTATGAILKPDSLILIISSYNPETSQTSRNISEFLDEYNSLSGKSAVAIREHEL